VVRGEDGSPAGQRVTLNRPRTVGALVSDTTSPRSDRVAGVIIAAILLAVGSATPLPTRYNPDFGPVGPDKGLHLLGHAGLAAALVAASDEPSRSIPVALLAVVASTAYGVGTELLQELIPGRAFERGDVLAALLGSLFGVLWWPRFTAERDST
jgi:VanZ family protein